MNTSRRLRLGAASAALFILLPLCARAQLTWSVFNETTTTAASPLGSTLVMSTV